MPSQLSVNLFRSLAILALLHSVECRAEVSPGREMTQPQRPPAETVRFHQTVSEGKLEELQAILQEGADPNAPGHVGQTTLMLALESKDLEKAKLLIKHGADPEATNDFNDTSLRRAVGVDFAEGVRYLLSLGVDRGYHPKYPLKEVHYDFPPRPTSMPDELKGLLSEAEWRKTVEEARKQELEAAENPTIEPMISEVQSVEVLKLFLEAGDDLNLAPTEVKRDFVGIETADELSVTASEFREDRSPRFGSQNPERMDCPFWKDMISTGLPAYAARSKYNANDVYEGTGPVWCYDRFGSSLTPLRDGRFVQIAGEHEDFYDPDFYIYNDVVIHDGKGNAEIYGYPRDVFQPTDFHSATLCADGIYIIGCLGYGDQRQAGVTPVYRLTLESWEIESIKTTGDAPGWIHRHHAEHDPERNVIRIAGGEIQDLAADGETLMAPNNQNYELDLKRLEWRRVD